MRSPLFIFFSLLFFPFLAQGASTDVSSPTPSSPSPTLSHAAGTAKALVVHKPMPSPAWGKLIQYHRQETFVLADKNRETLYEFVFQDDSGIIRTAIYHENPSGDGYWEVTVWDQP